MNTFEYQASPYYIHAPVSLDEGDEVTWQLHVLCSWLNQTGYSAYLLDAPKTDGRLWTPSLKAQHMAAHHLAGRHPISIAQAGTAELSPRPGLPVAFYSECVTPAAQWGRGGTLEFEVPGPVPGSTIKKQLSIPLPWVDPTLFCPPPAESPRSGELVYTGRLPELNQKPLAVHSDLTDLSQHLDVPLQPQQRAKALKQAVTLYTYTKCAITTEARLCGCEVVYVPNDYLLQTRPSHPIETQGCFFGLDKTPMHPEQATQARQFGADYAKHMGANPAALQNFIQLTQRAAAQMPAEKAWKASHKDRLGDWLPALADDKANQADAAAYKRLAESYAIWKKRATLREVHADICAEHIALGHVTSVPVHVFAHGRTMDALAATLDDVAASWLSASEIVVHAPYAPPIPAEELGAGLSWLLEPLDGGLHATTWHGSVPWCVLVDAGTRLEPHTLLELMLEATTAPLAKVICAADDTPGPTGARIPFFKGNGHLEWLRATNYLGGVVAVKTANWLAQPDTQSCVSAYRLALAATAEQGAGALRYIDKVLSHAPPDMPEGREKRELEAAQDVLSQHFAGTQVQATDMLGCWRVRYADLPEQAVSVVVPTGKELGYLRSLLASVHAYGGGFIDDIVLLVQKEDLSATQSMLASLTATSDAISLRVVPTAGGEYNHARSLNEGLAAARNGLVLICDDDVELIEKGCIEQLRRLFSQPDVAMAAPRLVLQVGNKPLLMSGPCVSGEGGELLVYLGDQRWLTERGQFNRLQTPQDVAGVFGSCYMVRKSAALAANGWDEIHTKVFQTTTDLGYRIQQNGGRIVWTPAASVLHAGGATLRNVRRNRKVDMAQAQQLLQEKEYVANHWLKQLPSAGLYSRHWSAKQAYALDSDLVVDWDPARAERPKVLAQPISSGSGQYRVVEPLDCLQNNSLAQTCLVDPVAKKTRRVLSAIDIVRAKPDRVLVQHSIGDEDIANLRAIKAACPDTFIIQLMDDLTSDLPKSHPGYVQGQRMSHSRTLEALSLSNRLLVSTQPLADYYREFCPDVRVVPNTLDARHWGSFYRPAPNRERLRVGWAGAAQHQGDLKLIESVISELATEVDFVFMGMCPKEIRPHIKEFHSFVSYKDYPAKLATLDLDIALAPLEDNPFNACKSNLRLLEYGAMGWPVVCSDVYPFRTAAPPVTHVGTDPTAWVDAIRRLMESQPLRAQRGQALNSWFRQHFLLENQVNVWFSAIFD